MIDFIRLDDAIENIARLVPVPPHSSSVEETQFFRWEIAAEVLSSVIIQWWKHEHPYTYSTTDTEQGLIALKSVEGDFEDYCLHVRRHIQLHPAICFSPLGFVRHELIKALDEKGIKHSLVKPTTNDNATVKGKELRQALYEIWCIEGKPEMKVFFPALKKYVGKKGNPIRQHYTAGKFAGIEYETSYGTIADIKKKTISNYVASFKKQSRA